MDEKTLAGIEANVAQNPCDCWEQDGRIGCDCAPAKAVPLLVAEVRRLHAENKALRDLGQNMESAIHSEWCGCLTPGSERCYSKPDPLLVDA